MPLNGCFSPIGDKSISHRIALLAILANGECEITNYSTGEDCQSSLSVFEKLGGAVKRIDEKITITGLNGNITFKETIELDCGNSGTTIRFLMGILAGLKNGSFRLIGDEYLCKRPMERIAKPLRKMGATISTTDGKPPINISVSELTGIEYTLPVASAQLKSAILLAGLNCKGTTKVIEPTPSRNHTEFMLKSFGANIYCKNSTITISPGGLNLPKSFYVPSDPSSAAFFLTAAALIKDSDVTAEGILLNPTRTHFLEVLKRMGADVVITERGHTPESWGDIRVRYNGRLKASNIEEAEVPLLVDEIPILSLAAALSEGTSQYYGLSELRVKETDRLIAVQEELGAYGANITIKNTQNNDTLIIKGIDSLNMPEGNVDSRGDHRMSMTLRLAHVLSNAKTEILNESCAAVSYPNFLTDLNRLLS